MHSLKWKLKKVRIEYKFKATPQPHPTRETREGKAHQSLSALGLFFTIFYCCIGVGVCVGVCTHARVHMHTHVDHRWLVSFSITLHLSFETGLKFD